MNEERQKASRDALERATSRTIGSSALAQFGPAASRITAGRDAIRRRWPAPPTRPNSGAAASAARCRFSALSSSPIGSACRRGGGDGNDRLDRRAGADARRSRAPRGGLARPAGALPSSMRRRRRAGWSRSSPTTRPCARWASTARSISLGLFRGVGLAQGGAALMTGQFPNMVWLYRRPILDYWAEHEETLGSLLHVLVHEIGHHFGLSDDDMEAIEAAADETRAQNAW